MSGLVKGLSKFLDGIGCFDRSKLQPGFKSLAAGIEPASS
jgi:hypothetical protein